MKVLFLTLLDFNSLEEHNIYTDLLREFVKHQHQVFVISPVEKRHRVKVSLVEKTNVTILKPIIGNIQKTNVFEKGISTLKIEKQFIKEIKTFFKNVKFDLLIYSTPPITFCNVIEFIKKRDDAKTYLLLKDIFPQNAVDIGIIKNVGVQSILYKYFRSKEKKLYLLSDYIGCMSPANVDYVIKHNSEVNPNIVNVCPNCVEPIDMSVDQKTREAIRRKYGIPISKKIFVYGGNIGKPQGVEFLIKCLESQKNNENVYFLIIGDGTEFGKIEHYVTHANQKNLKLIKWLDRDEYDAMVGACDVGMIFLDYRFTIPNFPSRLLSYMKAKLPVFAVTDLNTDIGKIIVEGGFGWWCESNNISNFSKCIESICESDDNKGESSFSYLCKNYSVSNQYNEIIKTVGIINTYGNQKVPKA